MRFLSLIICSLGLGALISKHNGAQAALYGRSAALAIDSMMQVCEKNSDDEEKSLPIGWNSCGHPSDQFKLELFTLTPDPPRRSRELHIRVKGNLKEPLNGGLLNYTVHYGIIPIVHDSLNLCDALRMEPKVPQCPLRSGDWDVVHVVKMPREVPFGRYKISAAAWDEQGRQIFCLRGCTKIPLMAKTGQIREMADLGYEGDLEDSDYNNNNKVTGGRVELYGNRQVTFPFIV